MLRESPWTEEPSGLQLVGHKESDRTERPSTAQHIDLRNEKQKNPIMSGMVAFPEQCFGNLSVLILETGLGFCWWSCHPPGEFLFSHLGSGNNYSLLAGKSNFN